MIYHSPNSVRKLSEGLNYFAQTLFEPLIKLPGMYNTEELKDFNKLKDFITFFSRKNSLFQKNHFLQISVKFAVRLNNSHSVQVYT